MDFKISDPVICEHNTSLIHEIEKFKADTSYLTLHARS